MTHLSSSVRPRRARFEPASAAVINGTARGIFPAAAAADPAGAPAPANGSAPAAVPTMPAPQQRQDDWTDTGQAPAAQEREIAARSPVEAELQRAKDAAEAANAAKTRYLVAVSHEIRAPLNAIYGYAQLLERDGAIAPAEAGAVIRRSAEHLSSLVDGILEIARIESGRLEVHRHTVEFPDLLARVMSMFRMQAQAKGIELHYREEGRVPRFVRTDAKRLSQVLINLLSNAVKYTHAGSVTLSVAFRSEVADIVIADTGIGIAPEDLPLVFEPFERGGSPEAALQPGIGLGLAITRALSRMLGGEIVATSTPGHGSRFKLSIFLPEVAGDHSPALVAEPATAWPKEAGDALRRIRQLAAAGHIRAVAAALDQLAAEAPDSAAAVAALRVCVDDFDLRSLMKMLDGHQPD